MRRLSLGSNYAAAVERLREAFVELASVEAALQNAGIGNDVRRTFGQLSPKTKELSSTQGFP